MAKLISLTEILHEDRDYSNVALGMHKAGT